MDSKFDFSKMWKDLQDSAREFASYGLQVSSQALELTAGTLSRVKENLAKTAERINPDKTEPTPPQTETKA